MAKHKRVEVVEHFIRVDTRGINELSGNRQLQERLRLLIEASDSDILLAEWNKTEYRYLYALHKLPHRQSIQTVVASVERALEEFITEMYARTAPRH